MILTATPASAALSPAGQAGRAAMEKAQCNRCHLVTDAAGLGRGLAPADRAMHCVDCHTWILGTRGDPAAIERQRVEFPDWDRYLGTIVHFTRLPDLGTLTRRVRPGFVRRYLDEPFDLRPHLEESMIPVRLSAAEKDAVVAYLAELNAADAAAPAAPPPADAAARAEVGRARFAALGCPTCHVVGNIRFQPGFDRAFFRAVGPTAANAPNLRHVRDRMSRDALVRFVRDPASVDPRTAMPKVELSVADAEAIADFLLWSQPDLAEPQPAGPVVTSAADVPLLPRKVPWDEVYDEILGRICVHCHMDPASNAGDGGAGNTGGLGWAGAGLSLESYAGLKRGMRRDGRRVSVLEPAAPGEPPRLLASLLRRHREGRDLRPAYADAADLGGGPDPVTPGMPLGLPPMDVAQLSLVKTWLAQGAPGPKGRSGRR